MAYRIFRYHKKYCSNWLNVVASGIMYCFCSKRFCFPFQMVSIGCAIYTPGILLVFLFVLQVFLLGYYLYSMYFLLVLQFFVVYYLSFPFSEFSKYFLIFFLLFTVFVFHFFRR